MPTAKKTVSQIFQEFLSDQEARISPKTLSKYENIISLFESYLESYWPGHDQEEYNRITKQGGTFCGTFGPEEIPGGYGEFLWYFMPCKVICGKDTLKMSGTVTKKLAEWLVAKGYLKDTKIAQQEAREAAKDLPDVQEVLDLLAGYVDVHAPDKYKDEIEGHFWIRRIESGKLWLEPITGIGKVIGPVPVPKEVTASCQEMWDIGAVVVKTARGWRFLEVWSVSP
jgi:hypothetical protein